MMKENDTQDTLYAFRYNECVYESSWATISLHYSKEGAEKAMNDHKTEAKREFDESYADDNEYGFVFGNMENWCVVPVKVMP